MPEKNRSPNRPARPSAIVLTRPMLGLLAALLLIPWIVVFVMSNRPAMNGTFTPALAASSVSKDSTQTLNSAPATNRTFVGQPGPWGRLEYTRIAIEPPEQFLEVNPASFSPPHWVFVGFTREKTLDLLKSAELTDAQMVSIAQKAAWSTTAQGTDVMPDRETVLSLSQKSRQKIYSVLARFPANPQQNSAHPMRQELVDERFEHSGLSEKTLARVKGLLYPHGNLMLFGDMEVMLSTMPSHQERMQLIKAMSRRVSLLVRLNVDEHSNIDELVGYWGFEGRAKDIRPLLESLARVPGGGSVDITHLLPAFARERLYTYPFPTKDPILSRRDCHWTSFNFFNDPPNDKYLENDAMRKAINADFYQISTGARLGDIVLLMKPGGETVHSAVFIADDIVFTKNGAAFTQPWTLSTIQHLLAYYSAFYPPDEPLAVVIYRRKSS